MNFVADCTARTLEPIWIERCATWPDDPSALSDARFVKGAEAGTLFCAQGAPYSGSATFSASKNSSHHESHSHPEFSSDRFSLFAFCFSNWDPTCLPTLQSGTVMRIPMCPGRYVPSTRPESSDPLRNR